MSPLPLLQPGIAISFVLAMNKYILTGWWLLHSVFCHRRKAVASPRSANAGIYGHDFCNVDFCEKSFVDQLRAGRLTFESITAMFFAPHMLLVCFTAESSCDTGWPGYGIYVDIKVRTRHADQLLETKIK